MACMSLPVRGAWVEIGYSAIITERWTCRSPCGERGLKCNEVDGNCYKHLSLPVRGAWVEIIYI